MFKYTVDELWQLKGFSDNVREAEKRKVEPLTSLLLAQLVHRAIASFKYYPDNFDGIFETPMSGACGCMGARGELFCGCVMQQLLYEYRYDVAITVLNIMEECAEKGLPF